MFNLPKKIIDEIPQFRENLEKYLAGELKGAFFRGIRVPWGNYSQRGGKLLMSRLRIPAGILTPPQLTAIARAAQDFADGKLHLTTRQDIQIHNLPFENSIKVIEYLKDFNLSPGGGGGNTVRNITSCYLSGICPREKIEVHKIVWGLTEYLLAGDAAYNLPRKFKIAFSGCEKDCAFSGINDLGFLAADDGFKVLCGGGMGAKSAVGKVLHDRVSQAEIGSVVKAVINIFNKYGDRKNRHHNRLRFLIQHLGWEKFVELYKQELERIKKEEYIVLRTQQLLGQEETQPLPPSLTKGGGKEGGALESQEYQQFLKYNVGQQKQAGYRYLQIRILCGEIEARSLFALCELASIFPEINFRTTHRQNLVITNLPEDKIHLAYKKIKEIFKNYLFPETVLDVISCKAATTCNLGVCNAIALAPEVARQLEQSQLDIDQLKEVRINISGCPNSCGHHPLGTVSLSGMAKKVHNRTVPFYKVWMGARVAAENTQLAEEVGIVPARAALPLLVEHLKNLEKGRAGMVELLEKYAFVPSYEEDRSYYVDFGRSEDFSMEGITQGECGAGVIDMVESDLASAKQALIKAREKDLDLAELKSALVYSARALLVVKGIDPRDEREAVAAFVEKFVKTGICPPDFGDLGSIYQELPAKKIPRDQAYTYAEKLYEEVKKIYAAMDSNFNFAPQFGNNRYLAGESEKRPEPAEQVYDLRGTPCPINYVKTKIKLEGMENGEVLAVYLDAGEPIESVPKSLEADGQEVIKIEPIENYFKVVVKKRV
jgi:sulfite reductase (ferredoxin)